MSQVQAIAYIINSTSQLTGATVLNVVIQIDATKLFPFSKMLWPSCMEDTDLPEGTIVNVTGKLFLDTQIKEAEVNLHYEQIVSLLKGCRLLHYTN